MNKLSFFLIIIFSSWTYTTALSIDKKRIKEKKFNLTFMTVGFGSNMFEMEPVFKVNGTKFLYTFEEVWILPKQKKRRIEKMLNGVFRQTSIDSINSYINQINDTLIYRTNIHIISGSACFMAISNEEKRVKFNLHNATDSIANKIMTVLNSYIPNKDKKLYITH